MRHSHFFITASIAVLMAAGALAQMTEPDTPPAQPGASTPGDKFGGAGMMPLTPEGEQAAAITGSLAIQAVQGTPGAEPIGAARVEVQLFHRGMLADTIEAQLDEHGVTMLEDLPVGMAFQPVVIVHHAGVTYQRVGEPMDAEHPDQKIEVTCYEITNEVPEWSVQMLHLMIAQAPGGLNVTEILVLENPASRTWLGAPDPAHGEDARPVTTVFALPEGAQDVSLGMGFHDWCCSEVEDGRLVNHVPLMPGRSEMRFTYHIPVSDGTAKIDVAAPAPVSQMMVIVPDSVQTEVMEGLELGGTQQMADQAVRFYLARGLAEGQLASLTLTGITGVAATDSGATGAAAPVTPSTMSMAKLIAAIGGGVILLLALVIIFSRSAKTAADT